MSNEKKLYADVKNPVIAAAIEGLYSFTNEIQARKFLEQLKQRFIVSRTEEKLETEVGLWIKDYALTIEEFDKGYKGNFGSLKIVKKGRTKYTLAVEKVVAELKNHPVREYVKKDNPNWGHPVLRSIKKKKIYNTIEAAKKDLLYLQEEFPLVCIPATDKLYAMVYEKLENKSSVTKYIFFVNNTPEGKFFIDYKRNEHVKKQAAKNFRPATPEVKQESVGAFTSQVLLKRASKKRSNKPVPKKPETNN